MTVVELLQNKKRELDTERVRIDAELRQVEAALAAVEGGDTQVEAPPVRTVTSRAIPIDDAIVTAVAAGNKTPVEILQWLRTQMSINTTIGSVRTRVSRLGSDGKIGRNSEGWVPIPNWARDPSTA